jgi:hypothetical protein
MQMMIPARVWRSVTLLVRLDMLAAITLAAALQLWLWLH